jgi:hypothetical protein
MYFDFFSIHAPTSREDERSHFDSSYFFSKASSLSQPAAASLAASAQHFPNREDIFPIWLVD